MDNNFQLYTYRATVTGVYDGDTITADIDLGMGVWSHEQKIRLRGINTPEIKIGTAEDRALGAKARDYLRSLLMGKTVVIRTFKDKKEKFGRWLADVWIDEVKVNDRMIESGHAVPFMAD